MSVTVEQDYLWNFWLFYGIIIILVLSSILHTIFSLWKMLIIFYGKKNGVISFREREEVKTLFSAREKVNFFCLVKKKKNVRHWERDVRSSSLLTVS